MRKAVKMVFLTKAHTTAHYFFLRIIVYIVLKLLSIPYLRDHLLFNCEKHT